MSRRTERDDGLTLIELLVTVALMGAAFAIIVTGMLSYVSTGIQHRSAATVQLELHKYADLLSALSYQTCATPYSPAYTAPTNVTVSMSKSLWDGTTKTFSVTPAAGCSDPGLQRVRVTMTYFDSVVNHGYTESLDIVKRQ
jgi:prepilin-type N-terminal cleavage/methylation domain-containing protein